MARRARHIYALDTTCASWDVNAISLSCSSGVVTRISVKPILRHSFFTVFRVSISVFGIGVSIIDAFLNRLRVECSKPENSSPAIGCAPKRQTRVLRRFQKPDSPQAFYAAAVHDNRAFLNKPAFLRMYSTSIPGIQRNYNQITCFEFSSSSVSWIASTSLAFNKTCSECRNRKPCVRCFGEIALATDPPISPSPVIPTFI